MTDFPAGRPLIVCRFFRLIAAVRFLLLLGCLGITLASPLERLDWRLQLASHWKPHAIVGLLVLGLWYALLKSRAHLVTAAAGILFNCLMGAPAVWASFPASAAASPRASLKVVTFNVNFGNERYANLLHWIWDVQPDVLILVEMTPGWKEAMEKASTQFPWQAWTAGSRYGDGIGIFSRHPLSEQRILTPGGGIKQATTARLTLPGGVMFRVAGLHPMPPRTAEELGEHDAYLQAFDAWAALRAEPLIVAGDFNTTPWSYGFRLASDLSRLRGANLTPTWPVPFTRIGLPIDQVLVSAPATVTALQAGPELGSDHLPLIARIEFPSGR